MASPQRSCGAAPGVPLPDEMNVLLQPDGGFLRPSAAWWLTRARRRRSARTCAPRSASSIGSRAGDGVRVQRERGSYEAERLVLCAGAWSEAVAGLPAGLVEVERQVLGWFEQLEQAVSSRSGCPVFNVVVRRGAGTGFPVLRRAGLQDRAVYAHRNEAVDPDVVQSASRNGRTKSCCGVRQWYSRQGQGRRRRSRACLFENSRTSTSCSTCTRSARRPWSPPASPGTGSSSAR